MKREPPHAPRFRQSSSRPALGSRRRVRARRRTRSKGSDGESASPSGGGAKYKEACKDGNTKYAARDFAGAIAAYQKAIELDPNNGLGHYLLGEAQLAAGNLIEAEAAWNRASLATDKDPALRARVLFVLADLKERQKKWDEARAAWQVYLDWASKFPNAGAFPGSAQSRQQAIDSMKKQDTAYAVVRQRIADTKAGGVFTDLSKPPPPGSPSNVPVRYLPTSTSCATSASAVADELLPGGVLVARLDAAGGQDDRAVEVDRVSVDRVLHDDGRVAVVRSARAPCRPASSSQSGRTTWSRTSARHVARRSSGVCRAGSAASWARFGAKGGCSARPPRTIFASSGSSMRACIARG